jgi:hypothetical protein
MIPGPDKPTPTACVLRQLAIATEALSAQKVCEAVADVENVRLNVESVRHFLHANKQTLTHEARRGAFSLGAPLPQGEFRYTLN